MIAINDTTFFADVDLIENNVLIIPTTSQISSLIGVSTFVNTAITSAFKTLLSDISNTCLNINTTTQKVKNNASYMFTRIGFSKNEVGTITFNVATNALDIGTKIIINSVNNLTTYREKAYAAFHGNSWAKRANDIRDLTGSNMNKIHHITVYNNSNLTATQGRESEANILNIKDESTQRFLKIKLDNNGNPVMPDVRIYNNSNLIIQLRLKVEHVNYTTTSHAVDRLGGFGPAEPYDLNNNGTITNGENVYLNRKFLAYYPNQDNAQWVSSGNIYTISISPQQHWDINYDTRIMGGTATIEFIAGAPNSSAWNTENLMYFKFYLRAQNPTYTQLRNYIISHGHLTRFWFLIRKIRHETGSFRNSNGLNQTNPNYEFQHFNRLESPANYSVRKNIKAGLPNFGGPRGFGLGQIDNYGDATETQVLNPPALGDTIVVEIDNQNKTVDFARKIVASDEVVWNWKTNLQATVDFTINEKMPFIVGRIQAMRDTIIAWNTAHPTNKVIVPPAINYDTVQYAWVESEIQEFLPFNNLFQQGDIPTVAAGNRVVKSFFDAMLIKEYNGHSGGGTFMALRTVAGKPTLIFNLLNNRGENYVAGVTNRND